MKTITSPATHTPIPVFTTTSVSADAVKAPPVPSFITTIPIESETV